MSCSFFVWKRSFPPKSTSRESCNRRELTSSSSFLLSIFPSVAINNWRCAPKTTFPLPLGNGANSFDTRATFLSLSLSLPLCQSLTSHNKQIKTLLSPQLLHFHSLTLSLSLSFFEALLLFKGHIHYDTSFSLSSFYHCYYLLSKCSQTFVYNQ